MFFEFFLKSNTIILFLQELEQEKTRHNVGWNKVFISSIFRAVFFSSFKKNKERLLLKFVNLTLSKTFLSAPLVLSFYAFTAKDNVWSTWVFGNDSIGFLFLMVLILYSLIRENVLKQKRQINRSKSKYKGFFKNLKPEKIFILIIVLMLWNVVTNVLLALSCILKK